MTDALKYFLRSALRPEQHMRPGQKFINELYNVRPDLCQRLTEADGLDPYYRDELLWAAVEWTQNNWGER